MLSTTAANLITTVLLIWKARLWRDVRPGPVRGLRRQMPRYCVPLVPTAIFWWIMGVSDRYMVKWFLGSDANGIYAVAYKIPTILTILAAVFLGAGGIIALSPLLIRLLAEEAYYDAWRYIPVLTLSMAAAAFSNFLGSVYVVTKRSAASFWTSLAGAGTNIVLNLWLIPRMGLQGAAATFASCLVVFLIRLVNARQLLPFLLSGRKLAIGVTALLIQTLFLLFRWPGWVLAQLAGLAVLLLLGLPALLSTLRVTLYRKQANV